MKLFKAPVVNIRMVSINGIYCYINQASILYTESFREYIKYKFVKIQRVSLVINLLSIPRIDENLIKRVEGASVRYTVNKHMGESMSATAEIIFNTPDGRDQYLRDLVSSLTVVSGGGVYANEKKK